MRTSFFKTLRALALISTMLLTSACSEQDNKPVSLDPVHFTNDDSCHICGMVITRFPGPKGQALDKRSTDVRKFCSTSELIFWYLQPENKANTQMMYVHDMQQKAWRSPNDDQMIDAKKAWYVIGSSQSGSMGPTLATFSNKESADAFARSFGGEVETFDQLSLERLNSASH